MDGLIRCGKCKRELDPEQYPPSQRHNGGYCRDCKRSYEKAHPRKRYKPDRPYSDHCYQCGAKRDPDDRLHVGYCGVCFRAYNRKRYAEDGRRITANCSMCGIERVPEDRVHQAYCPDCFNAWRIQRTYGITPDDYAAMLEKQGGGCAICGVQQSQMWRESRRRPLVIDHCHTSGKIRALLCDYCNRGLGQFRDSPALLRKAAEYLEAHASS
jgi:hypothetical protein